MIFKQANIFKYSGAGNTFCIMSHDDFEGCELGQRNDFAKKICSLTRGLGADGFVIVRRVNHSGADFAWDFYNSDGSYAEMCGNAARCVGAYCAEILEFPNDKIKIITGSGLIHVSYFSPTKVHVEMSEIDNKRLAIDYEIEGETYHFHHINSGVPHFVVETTYSLDFHRWLGLAKEVRQKADFSEKGSNVTIFRYKNSNSDLNKSSCPTIEAVTFERGIENFTAACGTGAVAAARIVADQMLSKQVNVLMPGGLLQVDFTKKMPILSGEAILLLQAHVV